MQSEGVGAEQAGPAFRPWAALACVMCAIGVAVTPIASLSGPAQRTLVILTLVAGLWLTEALPVAVTALLIPVLSTVLGVADSKRSFAGFGDPIIFLFFGTFLLTCASFDHGINARLARTVIGSRFVRDKPERLLWAVAIIGALISAWVNNTATTVLMLPLALSAKDRVSRSALASVLLMSAYAPSIAGIATPVGTAPNLIGLRLIEEATGMRLSFARWCALFAPLAIIGTACAAAYMTWIARKAARRDAGEPTDSRAEPRADPELLAPAEVSSKPWSQAEKLLVAVFVAVITLWITPGILQATSFQNSAWLKAWSRHLPEAVVPLIGGLSLFALPSGTSGRRILDIGVLRRVEWSTLLLFGGGLTLGSLMFETGLARWIGEGVFAAIPVKSMGGIVFAATLMAIALSEVTSNTASASLVVPVVLALAQTAGVDPVPPAIAATVACSFGFMLPVSTPPNALVYGTGRVTLREMIRYGILLDLLGLVLVSGWVTLFAS